MRILVVEDEPDLLKLIEYNLSQAGYLVQGVGSALAAQRAIAKSPPDLVVLDLMLPDLPGTEVCRQLRRDDHTRATPVIMLTAKGEESSRVYGLEIGADDYLVKPVSMRELVLRVGAILRRSEVVAPAASAAVNDVETGSMSLSGGGIQLMVEERRAIFDGGSVDLTELETRLLATLMKRTGRVQSRDVLLNDVWDGQEDISPRTVDMRIKRLRSKLGSSGDSIEAVRGLGYRFCAGGE